MSRFLNVATATLMVLETLGFLCLLPKYLMF